MRDSAYSVLEALTKGPKSWTELKQASKLTDGGLQKVLHELLRFGLVEQKLVKGRGFMQEKRYVLSRSAAKETVYEKARELKESLDRVAKTRR